MNWSRLFFLPLLFLSLVAMHCEEPVGPEPEPEPEPSGYTFTPWEQPALPAHFPPVSIPDSNPMSVEKIHLGKLLFFDPILSEDQTISCASCHTPSKSFSDSVDFSKGVGARLGARNAMPLHNIAYNLTFFWDGGVSSLEDQAIHPIINEVEMRADPAIVIERLNAHPDYPALFDTAFGEGPSVKTIVNAIASYERTLISSNAPYDRWLAGESDAMTGQQLFGLFLFNDEKGECFHCHTGYNFTDGSFHNNGLYENYLDEGRAGITGSSDDIGKFRTPSLRNIELTGPFMHDGSMETLEEVVAHYASRGKDHPNRSDFLDVIDLNEEEQAAIVAFLKALTDEEFVNNPDFVP